MQVSTLFTNPINSVDALNQFRAAIQAAGLTPPDVIEPGKMCRFPTKADRKDNAGWYILFVDDFPAGEFGDFRSGVREKWRMEIGRKMTPQETVARRNQQEEISRARESFEVKRRSNALRKAAMIWQDSAPATGDHPYLTRKGIGPHGLRVHNDALVVPVSDEGKLRSLQFISPDGNKKFLKDGRVKGSYYPIGIPEGRLCVAEGYATAASIHEASGHATVVAFDSGNLLAVAQKMRAKFPDINLVICGDDDIENPENPGLKKASEAAHAVDGFWAAPDFGENRPDGATDFNDLHQHAGIGEVRRCIDQAKSVAWPEPLPLPEITPDVEPFCPQFLPDAFAWLVEDVAERMQCPPDFPAVGLMVSLAAVVGRQVAIRPKARDDWTVVANLWGGIVGRPGLLKTPALQEAMRHINFLEARAREEHESALVDSEAEKLVSKARMESVKGKLKKALEEGDNAMSIAKDAIVAAGKSPVRRRYLLHDPTVEKLGVILAENPRGVMLFRDELTGFLRNLDKRGRESDRAFYLEAWGGKGRYSYDRIERGTLDIEAICVSILGGIQPGPLSGYLSQANRGGAGDDGLVQRFQMLVWPDVADDWKNVDRPPDVKARDAVSAVFSRLDTIDLEQIGAQIPRDGSLPFLRFTLEAQTLFDEWRLDHERKLREPDLPEMVVAHFAKYSSLIPSLALLIHLADGKVGPVDHSSLVKAAAWGEYLASHARRVYAPALLSDLSAAHMVGSRISRGDLGTEFSVRDIQQKGWSGLSENAFIRSGLDVLIELNWIRENQTPTEGRTKTRYVVNPAIKAGG